MSFCWLLCHPFCENEQNLTNFFFVVTNWMKASFIWFWSFNFFCCEKLQSHHCHQIFKGEDKVDWANEVKHHKHETSRTPGNKNWRFSSMEWTWWKPQSFIFDLNVVLTLSITTFRSKPIKWGFNPVHSNEKNADFDSLLISSLWFFTLVSEANFYFLLKFWCRW